MSLATTHKDPDFFSGFSSGKKPPPTEKNFFRKLREAIEEIYTRQTLNLKRHSNKKVEEKRLSFKDVLMDSRGRFRGFRKSSSDSRFFGLSAVVRPLRTLRAERRGRFRDLSRFILNGPEAVYAATRHLKLSVSKPRPRNSSEPLMRKWSLVSEREEGSSGVPYVSVVVRRLARLVSSSSLTVTAKRLYALY